MLPVTCGMYLCLWNIGIIFHFLRTVNHLSAWLVLLLLAALPGVENLQVDNHQAQSVSGQAPASRTYSTYSCCFQHDFSMFFLGENCQPTQESFICWSLIQTSTTSSWVFSTSNLSPTFARCLRPSSVLGRNLWVFGNAIIGAYQALQPPQKKTSLLTPQSSSSSSLLCPPEISTWDSCRGTAQHRLRTQLRNCVVAPPMRSQLLTQGWCSCKITTQIGK